MATAFNLLTAGGAKFGQRFRSDVDLFTQKFKGKSTQKRRTFERAGGRAANSSIPHDLDFFGASSSTTAPATVQLESSSSSNSETDTSAAEASKPQHKITIDGPEPLPPSIVSMEAMLGKCATPVPPRYLKTNLSKAGISSLWGVQCAVAGCLLAGRDTLVVAPTGSGKTLSYLLPLFVAMGQPCRTLSGTAREAGFGIRCVIIVPTYDLAVQIRDVADSLARGRKWRVMLLGKSTEHAVIEASGPDAAASHPLAIDVLICTPERLHHLLADGAISLANTRYLVLDEADRLLSDEFHEQTSPILKACTNADVQKCLLSATIPSSVEAEAKIHLKDGGTRVIVGIKDAATSNITQRLVYTGSETGKMMALRSLIACGGLPYPSLIFVQSIERANELYRSLVLDGLLVDVVHGDRSKSKREDAVKAFREGRVWVLVVTDVLARGMDFRGVKVVVNYDFPQTMQSYIHRIGRTGRAGRSGEAITYFSIEDGPYLRTVANVLRASGCEVPQYMLDMPKPSKNLKKRLKQKPVVRKRVGGAGRNLAREDAKRKKDIRSGTLNRVVKESTGSVNMDE